MKAFLEAQGLGITVYRDNAPANQAMPYITVKDGIVKTPEASGDFGDSAAAKHVAELVQVDVWQLARNPTTNGVAESYTLVPAVERALHGANLTAAPKRVYGCSVDSSVRLPPETNVNVVHDSVTIRLRRVL